METPPSNEPPVLARVELRSMQAPIGDAPESRFGERLREARQQLGLSVEALSRLCKLLDEPEKRGISPPTLGRYEANETLPGIRELRVLADALGVPVQWLVDGSVERAFGSKQADALLHSLREFVEMVQGDPVFSEGQRLSEVAQGFKDSKRAVLLREVRRPSDDNQV